MSVTIRRLPLCAALVAMLPSLASAAPPASCAHKFIGTWVYPGGTTVVAPGGMAYPKCPMCVPTQTWTCQGNTYLFSNSGPPGQFSATLSPDGRQLIGGSTVATRVGGPARGGNTASKEAAAPDTKGRGKKDAAPQQEPRQQQARTASRQQANCSDITGTKSGGKSRVNCKPSQGQTVAATQSAAQPAQKPVPAARTSPPPPTAPTADQQAALAGSIIDELGKVRSGQAPRQPLTGASASPDAGFDPQRADPYRPPETLPVEAGQPCVPYFTNMLENFKRRAALCLRDTRLLRSLTDMVETDRSTADDVYVTRNTAPELFAHFDPMDPRWTVSADRASPNCDLPLTVATQSEAFMECARVYLCGARAAHCGRQQAARTNTNQCLPISRACLAANPVPQRMTADPSPPPYREPPPSPPLPNPPHRESTITGPSGPGGGSSGGGVMSAQ